MSAKPVIELRPDQPTGYPWRLYVDGLMVQCMQNAIENANNGAKQHLERVNATNMHVAANMDQSSDTMLALLVEALRENGEATITISRPHKK